MGSVRLSATPGTNVLLRPSLTSPGTISIAIEEIPLVPSFHALGVDIILTNHPEGLRLEVVSLGSPEIPQLTANQTMDTFDPMTNELDISSFSSSLNTDFSLQTPLNTPFPTLSSSYPFPEPSTDLSSLHQASMDFDTVTALPNMATDEPTESLESMSTNVSGPGHSEFGPTSPVSDCESVSSSESSSPNASSGASKTRLRCRRPGCERSFKRAYTRQRHEAAHAVIRCTHPGCGTIFKRNHDRMRHEYLRHGIAENFCTVCKKAFVTEKNLRKHQCTPLVR